MLVRPQVWNVFLMSKCYLCFTFGLRYDQTELKIWEYFRDKFYHNDVMASIRFPHYWPFVRGTVGLRLDSSHRGEKWMFSLLLACISSLTNFQWSETPWWSCYVTLTIEGLPDEPTCRDYKGSYCWSQRETLCPYPWSRYGLSEVLTTYEWTPTQSGTR